MGITILKGAGSLVVSAATVHHQSARQRVGPQDLTRDTGRAGFAKEKEADLVRRKQPGAAILAIVAPTLFIRMLDRRLTVWPDATLLLEGTLATSLNSLISLVQ